MKQCTDWDILDVSLYAIACLLALSIEQSGTKPGPANASPEAEPNPAGGKQ